MRTARRPRSAPSNSSNLSRTRRSAARKPRPRRGGCAVIETTRVQSARCALSQASSMDTRCVNGFKRPLRIERRSGALRLEGTRCTLRARACAPSVSLRPHAVKSAKHGTGLTTFLPRAAPGCAALPRESPAAPAAALAAADTVARARPRLVLPSSACASPGRFLPHCALPSCARHSLCRAVWRKPRGWPVGCLLEAASLAGRNGCVAA